MERSHRNTCDYCERHIRAVHPETDPCERCLDSTKKLRTCSGCSLIRYCSNECQREDWPVHKERCLQVQQTKEVSAAYGSHVQARHKSLLRLTKRLRDIVPVSSTWAMGIGSDSSEGSDLSQTHVLLVKVDVEEHLTSDKPEFKYSIRDARCLSEAEIVFSYQHRWRKPIIFATAQENCVRFWIEDDGLPSGLAVATFEVEVLNMSAVRRTVWPKTQFRWLEYLQQSIVDGKKDIFDFMYNTKTDAQRVLDNDRWCSQHGERFGKAGLVALDISNHPQRLATHVLVIHVDVQQTTSYGRVTFRHTIQNAGVQTLQELKQLYYCDLFGIGPMGHHILMQLITLPPRMMRIIIVDDGLPFPKSRRHLGIPTDTLNLRQVVDPPGGWLAILKEAVDEY